jgi:hypothetical protein
MAHGMGASLARTPRSKLWQAPGIVKIAELRHLLRAIPSVEVPTQVAGIDELASFLASDAALRSIAADPYWPKWDSPWWHMLMLFELGQATRIPERAVRAMLAALDALPVHHFPLRRADWPPDCDPSRHGTCHCALGSMHQVLSACGIDVDAELPWVRPWFTRYQLADGGLSCDETAYLVSDECPSSMVGTIAAFEAMLEQGTDEFVERAAGFLLGRELVQGSSSRHNAAERTAASAWLEPTFPRFYFYDVLRGLTALVRWATLRQRALPVRVLAPVVTHLARLAPDGIVRVGRQAHAGRGTLVQREGEWMRAPRASTFALLDALGVVGAKSAALTSEWQKTRYALLALLDAGLVTADGS